MTREWKIGAAVYLAVFALACALPFVAGDPLAGIWALGMSWPGSLLLVILFDKAGLLDGRGSTVYGVTAMVSGALMNVGLAYLFSRWRARR
jgi:hypothetical protein